MSAADDRKFWEESAASLTISSMVLMDFDDLLGHVAELARVTERGGHLCASILHPIRMAGFPLGDDHLTFALGDYLGSQLQDWRSEDSISRRFANRLRPPSSPSRTMP